MLPTDSVVEWSDDTSGDQPLLIGDLLVWAPAVARPLDLHWLWVVTASEPEAGMSAMSIVIEPDAEGCWSPNTVSQVLADWTAVHAGRTDITYRYEPALISDLALRIAAAARDSEPTVVVESEDGLVHTLADASRAAGVLMTSCGRVVTDGWKRRGGLLLTPEMTDDECDAEFDRICC